MDRPVRCISNTFHWLMRLGLRVSGKAMTLYLWRRVFRRRGGWFRPLGSRCFIMAYWCKTMWSYWVRLPILALRTIRRIPKKCRWLCKIMGIRYSFEIFGFASFKSEIFVISVTIKPQLVKSQLVNPQLVNPQLVKSHLGLNGSAPIVENSAEILVNTQAFLDQAHRIVLV